MPDGDACNLCGVDRNYTIGTARLYLTKSGDVERSIGNVVLSAISEDVAISSVFDPLGAEGGSPIRIGFRRVFWLEVELDEATCRVFELALSSDALAAGANDRIYLPTVHERLRYAVRLEHTTPWGVGIDLVIPRASVASPLAWELNRSGWASTTVRIDALRTVGSPASAYGYLEIAPGVCLGS